MHRCTISHIDPDSPLRHAAHPGDRLVSINGNPITDVLDYKYYAYDPELAVCLRRPDGTEHTVHVSKPLGGERQRLGLARAFLHDAPFMLLDEPTSNLDSLNEAVILKSLREERTGKTVVLVSHRQSTMRIADTVYSVEHGRMS